MEVKTNTPQKIDSLSTYWYKSLQRSINIRKKEEYNGNIVEMEKKESIL